MARLELDNERCKGCLLCTTMCAKGLLKKGGEFNSLGFYTVEMTDMDQCNGCAMCAEICPDIAIMVWK